MDVYRSANRDRSQSYGICSPEARAVWDALIAACMLENDIGIIVTENEADFKRIPGITFMNPFKTVRGK